jgi:hypothetical protein
MSDLTTHAKQQLLKYAFTTDAPATRPTTWYLGLAVGDPGAAGTANEVDTGTHDANYARQAITTQYDGAGAFPLVENVGGINFPAGAAGVSYTDTHYTIWDAVSGGNCWAKSALPGGSVAMVEGKVLTVDAEDLNIDLEAIA